MVNLPSSKQNWPPLWEWIRELLGTGQAQFDINHALIERMTRLSWTSLIGIRWCDVTQPDSQMLMDRTLS